jgi:hypothetical protein
MAKFSLKDAFKKAYKQAEVAVKKVSGFVKELVEIRDASKISDDFARAALLEKGFTVLKRDSFQQMEHPPADFIDATEAVYTVANNKTCEEYSATVHTGHIVANMSPNWVIVRQCWVGNIQPKS